MDSKKKQEIALFRYGLIGPVLHDNVKSQMKYFTRLSLKQYDVPYIGRRCYKVSAFKKLA